MLQMAELFTMYVGSATKLKMKGWYRGAWFTGSVFGNAWSKTKFGLVMHQKGNEVLVEILQALSFSDYTFSKVREIPSEVIRAFAEGCGLQYSLKEIDGHLLVKGLAEDVDVQRPSLELAKMTNAYRALKQNGDALAEMIRWRGKVKTFEDAREVSKLLGDVERFVEEMKPDGQLNEYIKRIQNNIKTEMNALEKIDAEQRKSSATLESAREYLDKLGIEYKLEEK